MGKLPLRHLVCWLSTLGSAGKITQINDVSPILAGTTAGAMTDVDGIKMTKG
ncbi:MAG: hypothetical protein HOF84_02485 [Rhodospirillales bacterium]|nr:hypothetical protein [Rhodospirillales bacterium]